MAVPLAFLGILPPVILAEITQYDSLKTGKNREATYFAIRSLFIQFGQTLGLALFTILIGLDAESGTGMWLAERFTDVPFNELGIRLTGIIGFSLCLLAALIFIFFRYTRMAEELKEHC
jgi:GPH family glycoside/pentoside/hexuronide:cation symporter